MLFILYFTFYILQIGFIKFPISSKRGSCKIIAVKIWAMIQHVDDIGIYVKNQLIDAKNTDIY